MVIQPLARRNHTATLTAPRAAPLRSCLPPRGLAVSPPLVPLSRESAAVNRPRTRLGPLRDFVERADHRPEVVKTPQLFSNLKQGVSDAEER
jgi:hypothetical protein